MPCSMFLLFSSLLPFAHASSFRLLLLRLCSNRSSWFAEIRFWIGLLLSKEVKKLKIICFNNFNIPILWEKRETIPRTWSSKVCLLANFTHSKDIKVVTSAGRNPRQDQITMMVQSPGSTSNLTLVLLGFSIVHKCLHHSWILAKFLLQPLYSNSVVHFKYFVGCIVLFAFRMHSFLYLFLMVLLIKFDLVTFNLFL